MSFERLFLNSGVYRKYWSLLCLSVCSKDPQNCIRTSRQAPSEEEEKLLCWFSSQASVSILHQNLPLGQLLDPSSPDPHGTETIQMSPMSSHFLHQVKPWAPSHQEAWCQHDGPTVSTNHGPPLQVSSVCLQLLLNSRYSHLTFRKKKRKKFP